MVLDESTAIRLILAVIAVLGGLTSIEYLYALQRGELGARSLFAWEVCGSRQGWLFGGLPARLTTWCFQPTTFLVLMLVRIVGGIALVVLTDRAWLAIVSLGLTGLAGLLVVRHEHGRDGADQMMLILMSGVAAYLLFAPNSPWRWSGIAFIASQSVLAYFISGVAKLMGRDWRNGSALVNVFATTIYGFPRVATFLQQWPTLRVLMAWGLMVWEVSFPVVLIMPSPYRWIWLAIGAGFHVASAVCMGLNTFFLAFIGTYPAVLLLAQLIKH